MAPTLMEPILPVLKEILTGRYDDTSFETDLLVYVNSVFAILTQNGVGPDEGFVVKDETTAWKEFSSNTVTLQLVRSYVIFKVRLMFDPPASGVLKQVYEEQCKELEWRLCING